VAHNCKRASAGDAEPSRPLLAHLRRWGYRALGLLSRTDLLVESTGETYASWQEAEIEKAQEHPPTTASNYDSNRLVRRARNIRWAAAARAGPPNAKRRSKSYPHRYGFSGICEDGGGHIGRISDPQEGPASRAWTLTATARYSA